MPLGCLHVVTLINGEPIKKQIYGFGVPGPKSHSADKGAPTLTFPVTKFSFFSPSLLVGLGGCDFTVMASYAWPKKFADQHMLTCTYIHTYIHILYIYLAFMNHL